MKEPIILILDVDGVVTDPVEKKVTEKEIFKYLKTSLSNGNIVTLNTGRSNEWMIERVIDPLVEMLEDKSLLKNFFAVGEKGLTWVESGSSGELRQGVFDKKGQAVVGFELDVFLNKETVTHFKKLEKEAQALIDKKYSHSTFFDSSKKAMVSTEMKDGYNHEEYMKQQKVFTGELHKAIEKLGLKGSFKVDPTTIATDIQLPEAGKHLGARRILDWLSSKDITAEKFITVGDSSSDLEMADELYSQGKQVEFYYVNPRKPIDADKPYPIFTSKNEFEKGTLEILKSIAI